MKNQFLLILLFCPFVNLFAQMGDAHFENEVYIGDQNTSFGADLVIWKNTSSPSQFIIGNNFGHATLGAAHSNGAFSPIATPGDVIFKKNGNNTNFIFNLSTNGTGSNGSRKVIMGDETNLYTLVVTNNGKVGIGTQNFDSRNYKLYVKDGIATEEVMVELCSVNGWCDYVFEDDYPLPPLKYVEEHIVKYKHLPNIPSAKTLVEQGGIQLKEMTVLQQEKIEELFLYMIDLEKRLEELEGENNQLKTEIQELQNK